jgi:hypothetical protein
MPTHEHLHIGESHPFPRDVKRADAAKRLEDLGDICRGNATPVVAYMKHRGRGTAFGRDHNLTGAAGFEVGDGVSQKIPHAWLARYAS